MPAVVKILLVNPNSTVAMTEGMRAELDPICPPGVVLSYYTAPNHAPDAINTFVKGVTSAAACCDDLLATGALDAHDGFLVCCFSDHPLQHMLREHFGPASSKVCIGIFEAGISHALLLSRRFGVISTGPGTKPFQTKGVSAFLGASGSDRWAGVKTSGLHVLEIKGGDRKYVEDKIKATTVELVGGGADCIILGCAGYAGMEGLVQEGAREAGLGAVRVVDGTKAGLVLLAGLCRVYA